LGKTMENLGLTMKNKANLGNSETAKMMEK
jgi:hypothetical protein